ncbi:hypothetical protein [Parachlamydia sp. AcF125]|uniref:hypothetical protein n=1 Tax=Parachlamydia sp. AcF125 TaxID=2795736 RepID=UPI001BD89D9E|nr:hypothetical protein [Parachlamydia sp. AcF125]MBS4167743.1 hypothetical protein [Parachlamydia sp. AcF125]
MPPVSSSLRKPFCLITAAVVFFHLVALALAYYGFGSPALQLVAPKRMTIHTISLAPQSRANVIQISNPSMRKEAANSSPPPPIPAPSKQKEKPATNGLKEVEVSTKNNDKPVVEAPKKSTSKPSESQPLAPPQKNSTVPAKKPKTFSASEASPSNETSDLTIKKKEELLSIARENIAKIQPKNDKLKAISEMPTPTFSLGKIESLNIDQLDHEHPGMQVSIEAQYREELAYFLKKHLHLIEPGDVKLRLTLNRLGEVVQLTIVYAESRLNRELIEKSLPNLKFPSWQERFPTQQTYTCSMTLSHEALPF